MKISDFNPPEIYLLTLRNEVSGKQLFNYTVMDLVLKGVLKFYGQDSDTQSKAEKHDLIEQGPNFKIYEPLNYELPFLAPFKDYEVKMALRYYGNAVIQVQIGNIRELRRRVLDSPNLKGLVRRNAFYPIMPLIKWTTAGRKLGIEFNNQIVDLDYRLAEVKNWNDSSLKNQIEMLSNNVILLSNFDSEMALRLQETLSTKRPLQNPTSHFSIINTCYASSFTDFDDFGISESDSSGSSGCSSIDSSYGGGCGSGCGGCS